MQPIDRFVVEEYLLDVLLYLNGWFVNFIYSLLLQFSSLFNFYFVPYEIRKCGSLTTCKCFLFCVNLFLCGFYEVGVRNPLIRKKKELL